MRLVIKLILIFVIFILIFPELKFLYTVFTDPYFDRMTIYDLRARVPERPCKLWYKLVYYWNTTFYIGVIPEEIKKLTSEPGMSVSYRILKKKNREKSMPHTLGNYIILPPGFESYETKHKIEILSHELVHIAQKRRGRKSTEAECKLSLPEIAPLRRNNPDTDDCFTPGYLWTYSSEYPRDVNDVIKITPYEHPFEEEAYNFSEN